MKCKKKRGFVRQLQREIQRLQEDNNRLLEERNWISDHFGKVSTSLSLLRNRVRCIQYSRICNCDDFKSRVISTEQIKKDLVKEFLADEGFLDMIKVERDNSFKGLGTRLNVSIEVLTP